MNEVAGKYVTHSCEENEESNRSRNEEYEEDEDVSSLELPEVNQYGGCLDHMSEFSDEDTWEDQTKFG